MDDQDPLHPPPRRLFLLGCLVEASLLLVGAASSWLLGRGLFADLRWTWPHALLGAGAALPPLALFFWTCHTAWDPLRQIRRFLDQVVLPLFQSWTTPQLLLISLLAGLGEEFFFRAALQGGLAKWVGEIPALVLASLIFGCFHPMTWSYLILTALIGVYLGTLWLLTGNLLVPVLTHAVYDFAALFYFLKARPLPA